MPNWCYTRYRAVGDKAQLRKLYSIMSDLEAMENPGLHENGFGSTWLGNLVIKLGADWEKVSCRGAWDELTLEDDGTISFTVESAWTEPNEVRTLIKTVFPGIYLYYQSEEPGWGIYNTNDDTGKYFPERYYLWMEDDIGESMYYETLSEVIEAVEEITGDKNLKTFNCCVEALKSYSEKHNIEFSLHEFELLNCD